MKNIIYTLSVLALVIFSANLISASQPTRTEGCDSIGSDLILCFDAREFNDRFVKNDMRHVNQKEFIKIELYNANWELIDKGNAMMMINYLRVFNDETSKWEYREYTYKNFFLTLEYPAPNGYDLVIIEKHVKYDSDGLKFCKGELC